MTAHNDDLGATRALPAALLFLCILLACGSAMAGTCGNGTLESDETCDPPGQPAGQPDECRDDCTFCGDGIVDMQSMKNSASGEQCDDGNNEDGDGCSASCTVENDVCGNGIVEADETCDPPGEPAGQPDECRGDCTFCGDGIVDMQSMKDSASGEQCDDGNNEDGDGCSASCSIETAVCGNGIVEADETCDPPGEPAGQPDECRDDCTYCGDGAVDMLSMKDGAEGEACDDGNNTGGDGCRADCTVEECGDAILDPTEDCDDGNDSVGDGCRSDCTIEECGDGILDPGEGCDDGNVTSGDGCRADCTVEICGDGIVDAPTETCDPPGEPVGTPNECRADCTFCGDGVVDVGGLKAEPVGEACDDGNNAPGDGCRADCSVELCGDGIVDPGEECDDGNADDKDECKNDCTDGGLLVVLESFTATVTSDGVRIAWKTAIEIDTVGYRLLRVRGAGREKSREEVQLHEGLLAASGSELEGASYAFLDNATLRPGRYDYILEDVDLFGRVTRHGPVTVVIRPAGREAPAGRAAPVSD